MGNKKTSTELQMWSYKFNRLLSKEVHNLELPFSSKFTHLID